MIHDSMDSAKKKSSCGMASPAEKQQQMMQDMMQDPTTKAQMEQMASSFRSAVEL